VPLYGSPVILSDTLPGSVRNSKIVLRGGITLVCGFSVPLYGSLFILLHALSGGVHEPNNELRFGITRFC
ncbi:hypothetical protein PXW71_26150, partial [Klebsiella pneumoniae]